jgi:hypothetical protein
MLPVTRGRLGRSEGVKALLVLVALAFLGCGEAASPQPARLEVWETLPGMPRYIEGSIGFLRIESVDSGEVLAEGPVTDPSAARGKVSLFSSQVAPGEYRVASHQRPCNGNCSYLDPPVDRCSATVRVEGDAVRATVVLAQSGGCEIRLGR